MRRCGTILFLVAALAFAGTAPAALCAAIAAAPADCPPMPSCECDAAQPDASFAPQSADCCRVSAPSLPQGKVESAPLLAALHAVPGLTLAVSTSQALPAAPDPRARSAPPDLQSRLCVFLI